MTPAKVEVETENPEPVEVVQETGQIEAKGIDPGF